jgi:hypothetical protein
MTILDEYFQKMADLDRAQDEWMASLRADSEGFTTTEQGVTPEQQFTTWMSAGLNRYVQESRQIRADLAESLRWRP